MLRIEGLRKSFGEKEVIRGLDAEVPKGEIFVIIGPSGQGKSTILRLIDMLDTPTAGNILLDGMDITMLSDREQQQVRRRIGMVFQDPAIFRGSVYENVAYGLRFRDLSKEEVHRRVTQALHDMRLEGYEEQDARTLSGGEKHRVAFARTIVTQPEVILMDEPTSDLDPVTTGILEELIFSIRDTYNATIVLSTHDMFQGQRLGDRIAVMMGGTFIQTGTPKEVFTSPNNRDVAYFIGFENIFDGEIIRSEEGVATITAGTAEILAVTDRPPGSKISWCLRTEDIRLHMSQEHIARSPLANHLDGVVKSIDMVGPQNHVTIDCGIDIILVVSWRFAARVGLQPGMNVRVAFNAGSVHVMDG